MIIIDNYADAVVRFLSNKEEIRKEVIALIYTMLEDEYGERISYNEKEAAEVLKKLGDPNILALKYSNLPKKIVSEKYIYQFFYILAFILIGIVAINVFEFILSAIIYPNNIIGNIFTTIYEIIGWSIGAFGILAFIFMMLEHNNKEINIGKSYNPANLKSQKPVDSKKRFKQTHYSIGNEITGIIFAIAFLVFINLYMDIVYFELNNVRTYVFNMDYVNSTLWAINTLGTLGIAVSIFKIVSREKTIAKEITFYAINILMTIFYSIIFININLFTDSFAQEILRIPFLLEIYNKYGTGIIIERSVMTLIVIIAIFQTIDLLINLHRLIQMRSFKKMNNR